MPVNIAGCGACNTKQGLGSLSKCGFGRLVAFGFQKLNDSSGDQNFIDTTSATLGATLLTYTDMSVTPDYNKRIFMSPKASKFTIARSDENYATDDNNQRYKLGTGEVVTVTIEFWGETEALAEKILQWDCSDSQVYFNSVDGKFLGAESNNDHTKLHGWQIVPLSLTSVFVVSAPDNTQMVKVSFDLESIAEKQSTWAYLDSSQLGYNPTATLIPANHLDSILTPATTTTLSVVLRSNATASNKFNYGRDLTPANGATWAVYNLTDGTTLTPSSVTFTDVADDLITAGNEPEYTVTITAQTANDDLRVGVIVPKFLVQLSNTEDAL